MGMCIPFECSAGAEEREIVFGDTFNASGDIQHQDGILCEQVGLGVGVAGNPFIHGKTQHRTDGMGGETRTRTECEGTVGRGAFVTSFESNFASLIIWRIVATSFKKKTAILRIN